MLLVARELGLCNPIRHVDTEVTHEGRLYITGPWKQGHTGAPGQGGQKGQGLSWAPAGGTGNAGSGQASGSDASGCGTGLSLGVSYPPRGRGRGHENPTEQRQVPVLGSLVCVERCAVISPVTSTPGTGWPWEARSLQGP